jgi:hypothetical protein
MGYFFKFVVKKSCFIQNSSFFIFRFKEYSMQRLGLIFNSTILSILLFSHTSYVLAASHKGQKQRQSMSEKTLDAVDVWERVRSGMKITWAVTSVPSPKESVKNEPENIAVQEIENSAEAEKKPKSNYLIEPNKAVAPLYNYTELGLKIRFGDKPPVPKNEQQLAEIKTQEPKPLEKDKKDSTKNIINSRIQKHIDFFSQKPGYLYQVTERARPYLYSIVEELNKKQLPLELALLPIVESAYQPTAQSPKGAAGLWQFMPATGNDYGLKQNEQNDERLDIQASTRAAIHFLIDLKTHYKGDWLLALAAYNCGQGAVDNAISKNKSEGLDTDYWSLRLPKETQDYVPRLLALSNIFSNPANYGLKFVPIKNEPYLIKAKTGENQV